MRPQLIITTAREEPVMARDLLLQQEPLGAVSAPRGP